MNFSTNTGDFPSKMSSGNNDDPRPSKRQESTRSTSSGITSAGENNTNKATCATVSSQPQNEGVQATANKLTELVEEHPQLHHKVEQRFAITRCVQ